MDDALANPAFVELSSFYTVDNQTVDINVNIDPLGDFTNSLTLYVAIFEYMTYNNVGSNGGNSIWLCDEKNGAWI